MNLEHTEGKITFKPDMKIDLNAIAKAVVNAGFSVRYLTVSFKFNTPVDVSENFCYRADDYTFRFFPDTNKTLSGEVLLKLIGKGFQPAKEFKQWKRSHKQPAKCEAGTYYDVSV